MKTQPPERNRVRQVRIIAPAVAALGIIAAGAVVVSAAAPVSAAPARPAVTADTAQPCNQLLNPDPHQAYICVTANAFQGPYGADYWMDEAYQRDMAWHPKDGLLAVSETFYCRPDGVITGGHVGSVDEGSTSTESWCARGAPGVPEGAQEWQARVITVADGCVVYGWHVVDTQASPPLPTMCLNQFTGKLSAMPKLDQESVIAFWHSMADEPGAW